MPAEGDPERLNCAEDTTVATAFMGRDVNLSEQWFGHDPEN